MPVFRSGEMELPTRWHRNSTGKHMLDVFRRFKRTAGIKLLESLLTYNPSHRLKAADALHAEWFTELPAPVALSLMPTFPTKHNKAT